LADCPAPGGAHDQALVLEVVHDGVEAPVFLAQQVLGRDAAIIEGKLGRVGTEPAGLVELAADLEARRSRLDDKERNTATALGGRVGAGGDDDDVAVDAVGDEHFCPIEHPLVTLANGLRLEPGHVRASAGFGHGDGADFSPGTEVRQVFLFLRLRAAAADVGGRAVRVHGYGGRKAAESGTSQLFGQHHATQRSQPGAAVFLRMTHAKKAKLAHLDEDFARYLARFFPGRTFGYHLGIHEAAHLVAQQTVLNADEFGIKGLNGTHGRQAFVWLGGKGSNIRATCNTGELVAHRAGRKAPLTPSLRPSRFPRRPAPAGISGRAWCGLPPENWSSPDVRIGLA